MDVIRTTDRVPPRENKTYPWIRNPNFRRNQTQIKQRDPKSLDQWVRPPSQENYIDEDGEIAEDMNDSQIHLMGVDDNDSTFITEQEQDLFLISQDEIDPKESK